VIRIIRENGLRLRLSDAFAEAFFGFPQAVGTTATPEFGMAVAQEKLSAGWQPPKGGAHPPMVAAFAAGLVDFLAERLRVQLRAEGARHDVVAGRLRRRGGGRPGPPAGPRRGAEGAGRIGDRHQPARRLQARPEHPPHRGQEGRPPCRPGR
jgi:hypothetical protein